jgi:hypothetical protein
MWLQVAITNVLLWFCIWTPYAAITMIAQFGNPMLITPVISQLPSFLGITANTLLKIRDQYFEKRNFAQP